MEARELQRKLDKLIDASGRTADAVEMMAKSLHQMAEAPPIDMVEPTPLFCPNCGTVNPEINVVQGQSSGNAADFVLVAECGNCSKTIYGIPVGWSVFATADDVRSATSGNGQQ